MLLPPEAGGVGQQITAVITVGTLAKGAYRQWADSQPDAAAGLHWAAVRHPTYPESASASGSTTLSAATAALLADWNQALPGLRARVQPEQPVPDKPYASTWQDGDLVANPEGRSPCGCPAVVDLAESLGRPHRHHRSTEAGDHHRHRAV